MLRGTEKSADTEVDFPCPSCPVQPSSTLDIAFHFEDSPSEIPADRNIHTVPSTSLLLHWFSALEY